MKVNSVHSFGKRSSIICRKMLEIICYGGTITAPFVKIDDSNRKEYFSLLMAIYSTKRKYIDSKRQEGIAESAKAGNYKGQKKIKLDKLVSQEVFSDYKAKKISSTEAAESLSISKSTFLRRYKEYREENQ